MKQKFGEQSATEKQQVAGGFRQIQTTKKVKSFNSDSQ